MRTILVPVEQHSLIHNVFDASIVLAELFGSYIEGAAIGVDLPEVPVMDISVGIPSVWDPEIRREQADTARKIFEDYFIARGVPRADREDAGVRWHWHPAGPTSDNMLGAEGRCFDVIMVGRPDAKERTPRLATAESALFDSGRPIMVIPPEPVKTLDHHTLIAWNGSSETARAIAMAQALLRKAKKVTVLGIEGWGVSGPSVAELARMLQLSGIETGTRILEKSSEEQGVAILRTAKELGCDLIVKGAYTQSRLRQMIFGGATNTLLHGTELPVLFAH